jgi:hypothetical protein
MRYLLIFWALPMAIFWGWFGLSWSDTSFGFLFLSREVHDLVFAIYGQLLGLDPATIPWLFAKACLVDTAIIFAILAYRRRKRIQAWWEARRLVQSPALPSA